MSSKPSTGKRSRRSGNNGISVAEKNKKSSQPRGNKKSAPSSPAPACALRRDNHDESKHQAPVAGTFLAETASFLTNAELVGGLPTKESWDAEACKNLEILVKFLSRHQIVLSFMDVHSEGEVQCDSASSEVAAQSLNNSPSLTLPAYYNRAIESFASTQIERQAAGLRTNIDKETTEGMNLVVGAHHKALEEALNSAKLYRSEYLNGTNDNLYLHSLLTKQRICSWHRLLCPLHPQSGKYRTTAAKAGRTLFCPAAELDKQMKLFLSSLSVMQRRFFESSDSRLRRRARSGSISEDGGVDPHAVYHAVAIGATFVWGINNIHPFADGNGRVSRIGLNCILSTLLGLPFSVVITATQQHRKEYVEGLKYADAASELAFIRLSNPEYNDPNIHPHGILSLSRESNPSGQIRAVLVPLIHTLLDRTANVIDNLQRVLQDKSRAATEEAEDRIARRVRERAAQGSCVVCLGDRPNIATLCCGQAVHIQCMAEWLANKETCVSCRGALPRMNMSQQRPRRTDDNNPDEFRFGDESDMSTEMIRILRSHFRQAINRQDTHELRGAEDENEDAIEFEDEDDSSFDTFEHRNSTEHSTSQDDDAENTHHNNTNDETTTTRNLSDDQYSDEPSEDDETTEEYVPPPEPSNETTHDPQHSATTGDTEPPPSLFCDNGYCRNKAALDCDNQMCGRCCVLHGTYSCVRHRS